MARNKSSELVRKGTFLIIISIVIKFIGMIYRIPLTNMLGDQGNGSYVLAFQIYSFVIMFSTYGVSQAISRMISQRMVHHEYANAHLVFRVGFLYSLAMGAAIFCLLHFGSDWLAGRVFNDISASAAVKTLAPATFLVSVACSFRGLFQGYEDVRPSSYADLIDQILHAAISILLVYFTIHSVENAAAVVADGRYPVLEQAASDAASGTMYGALGGLMFLMGIFFFFRMRSKVFHAPVSQATETWKQVLAAFLLTVIPMMLSATVANLREMIDTALFNVLMPLKGYDAAFIGRQRGILGGKFVVLTNMPIAALGTFSMMLIPGIAAAITRKDQNDIQVHIETLIKMVLMLALPAAVGLSVLGEPIVHWLYPNASDGGELFFTGSFIVVFYAISQTSASILQGLGRMRKPLVNAAIGLLVSTPVLVLCVLVFDAKAYSLVASLLAFSFTIAFLNFKDMVKYSGFRVNLISLFLPPVLCSAVMGGIAWLSFRGIHSVINSNTVSILGSVMICVVVYFLMILNSSWFTREQIEGLPYGHYLARLRFRKD